MRIEELLIFLCCVTVLDLVAVEELIRDLEEAVVHSILRVQEGVLEAAFHESLEHGGGSVDLEFHGWSQLVLVADEDDLLRVKRRKEGFVLLDLSRLVYHDTLDLEVPYQLGRRVPAGRHQDLVVSHNLLLELTLLPVEVLELSFGHLFDAGLAEAEELLFHLLLFSPDEEVRVLRVNPPLDHM